MEIEDYPSNSYIKRNPQAAETPEPKKIEQVVLGPVTRRKKPLSKRFTETFVGSDVKSVWSYLVTDVLVPATKDAVSDAVSQGIERMLFGEASGRGRRNRNGSRNQVNYNRYSSNSRPPWEEERRPPMSQRARATHDFDEIILDTRAEADSVIDNLFELISKYESASVADLYELVGITVNFTDNKYGWTDIRGASVSRVRSGYLLNLPRPKPLD